MCAGKGGVRDPAGPRDGDTGPFPLVSGVGWRAGDGGLRLGGGFGRGRTTDDATVDEFDGWRRGLEERGDFAGAAGGDCV